MATRSPIRSACDTSASWMPSAWSIEMAPMACIGMTSGARTIVTSSIASRPATPVRSATSPAKALVSTSAGAASAAANV